MARTRRYVLGLSYDGVDLAVICRSTHLTLFAVEDDSEALKLVDAKVRFFFFFFLNE